MDAATRHRLLTLTGIELRTLPPVEVDEVDDFSDLEDEPEVWARHRQLELLGVELRAQARIPKGFEGGGRWRKLSDTVFKALKDWAKGDGPDDPFDAMDLSPDPKLRRDQLRRVAKERGITLRRGASENEIKNALLDDFRGGKDEPDSTTGKPAEHTPREDKVRKAAQDVKKLDTQAEIMSYLNDAELSTVEMDALSDELGIPSAKGSAEDKARKIAAKVGVPDPDVNQPREAKVRKAAEDVKGLGSESEILDYLDQAGLSSVEMDALGDELGIPSPRGSVEDKARRFAAKLSGKTPAKKATPAKPSADDDGLEEFLQGQDLRTLRKAVREYSIQTWKPDALKLSKAETVALLIKNIDDPVRQGSMGDPGSSFRETLKSSRKELREVVEGLQPRKPSVGDLQEQTALDARKIADGLGSDADFNHGGGNYLDDIQERLDAGESPTKIAKDIDDSAQSLATMNAVEFGGVDPDRLAAGRAKVQRLRDLADRLRATRRPRKATPSLGDRQEQAARDRQAQIDDKRKVSGALVEVEELLANDASDKALRHRLESMSRRLGTPDPLREEMLAAVPHPTGEGGLSSDPAVRQAQVQNRIRAAFVELAGRDDLPEGDYQFVAAMREQGFVFLADIREALGDDVGRAEADKAIRDLVVGDPTVRGIPMAFRHGLSGRIHNARLRLGGPESSEVDVIKIEYPSPRPVPYDKAKLQQTLDRVAAEQGLTKTAAVGTPLRFDRKMHTPIGSGLRDGTPVLVVRPGFQMQRDGKTIAVENTVVEEIDEDLYQRLATARVVGDFDGKVQRAASGNDALAAASLRGNGDGTLRVANDPGWTDAQRAERYEALWEYEHGDYTAIHDVLREGGRNEATDLIDDVMSHSPLSSDVVVFRGIQDPSSVFGDRTSGDLTNFEWNDRSYVSTTVSEPRALSNATVRGDTSGVVMRIVAPKGTGAVAFDDGTLSFGSRELLLQRGLTLRVVRDRGVTGTEYGDEEFRQIDVEVVSADSPSDTPEAPGGDRAEALRDDLDLLTVPKLKDRLRELGLPLSGRKRDLVDRIVEAQAGGAGPKADAAPPLSRVLTRREMAILEAKRDLPKLEARLARMAADDPGRAWAQQLVDSARAVIEQQPGPSQYNWDVPSWDEPGGARLLRPPTGEEIDGKVDSATRHLQPTTRTDVATEMRRQASVTPRSMMDFRDFTSPSQYRPPNDALTDAYAYYNPNFRSVSLHPRWDTDRAGTEASTTDDIAAKFHPPTAGSGLDAVVSHEYGHHLTYRMLDRPLVEQRRLVRLLDDVFQVDGYLTREFRRNPNLEAVMDDFLTRYGSGRVDRLVSRYARKNHQEFFAEVWSEYTTMGDGARPHIKRIGEMMREMAEASDLVGQ
jgi:hypothetical protein